MDEQLFQKEMVAFIKQFPNNGNIMIPIHGKTEIYGTDAYFQCRLFPLEEAIKDMENDNVNSWQSISPGFTVYDFDEDECIYSRFNNHVSMEPFVIERNYDGLGKRDELEIVEEFRLLNNLYFDRQKDEYLDLENETTVVKIEDGFVRVHRQYLKRYLSVKEMVMLVHCDSRYFMENGSDIRERIVEKEKNKIYTLSINMIDQKTYSLLYAKTIIYGCPIKECGYWPYNEQELEFEDYAIAIDEEGNNVMFSSNPSRLSNFINDNSDAPHYLTPVFFKRDVLQKYYAEPNRYSVESGIIRCGTLWSLYIDNESSEYVVAYLGDLGRDLPSREQKHWKTYNIVIDGKLSKSKIMRDFFCRFTSSESPVFIFQNKYEEVNNSYAKKVGYPLFLPLHDDDKYIFSTLRIPLLDSQEEFDNQIRSLVKLIIDSLNEKEIDRSISPGEKINGSISKLEELFKKGKLSEYEEIVKFLRNLQGLRSASVAHKKGSNYEKFSRTFQLGEMSKIDVFEKIMNQANIFLKYVEDNLDKLSSVRPNLAN